MSKPSVLAFAVIVIIAIIRLLTDFLAHVLTQDKENRLRAQLEAWKESSMRDSDNAVFLPLFQIPAGILSRAFGPRALSWRSLRTCTVITSLLLVICFALALVFNGFISPDKLFTISIELLKKHAADFDNLPGDTSQFRRNASDLAGMVGPLYRGLYTTFYFFVIFGTTALFAALALAFCRRLLQTATQSKDLFSLGVILVSNICGAIFLLILQCSLLSVLLYPAFWPSVPPLLQAFRGAPLATSIVTAIASLFAPLFYWVTAASWLRIAVVLSVSPCLLVAGLIMANLVAGIFKQTCSGYVVAFLNIALKSRRGILQFFSFCFGLAVTLCSFIVWLAQLKLTPLLVGSLCITTLIRTFKVSDQRGIASLVSLIRTICLFVGSMSAVAVGYYLQALIECVRVPTAAPNSLADPFFSSLVPGAWVALWLVHVALSKRTFWRATLGFFIILLLVDLLRALFGEMAYSEFFVGVPFNAGGAPLGAWAVSKMDKFLFPQLTAASVRISPQEPVQTS